MTAPSTVDEDFEDDPTNAALDIDALQPHGINASDISKLRTHGYPTVASAHAATRRALLKVKGLSEVKVDKIKDAVLKCQPLALGFQTAFEYGVARRGCVRVSTGSRALDGILGGGFQTKSISEVFGEYRCGKTQLAHTMCVMVQLPKDMGGAEGKAAYIDTEGTFRPERIIQIAERFQLDADTAQENISYARALNSEHQMDLLTTLTTLFTATRPCPYRLLIVDSVIHAFRNDFSGRGELSERQQKLNAFLHRLTQLAEEFNLAVLLTNQVQSDPGAAALFAGADGRKPVGGHVLAHASATRVLLRKGRGEERVARIVDSPDVREGEATYVITAGGIGDADKI